MRIFLTGGSGFIGGALVRALASHHEVVAMARSDRSAELVAAAGTRPVRCDLEGVTADHIGDADAVIHCAAAVSDWAPLEDFVSANVDGTRRVLEAARRAGVRRFVHMSTDSVLFDGSDLVDVDETTPYPERSPFGYAHTKRLAEELVLSADGPDIETVAVRPCLVWGPGDTTILPIVTEMIDDGVYVWVDRGRREVTTTHIDNLVHGTILALERGRPGGVYFITDGDPVPIREFLTAYVATTGRSIPDRSLPAGLVRTAGRLLEWVWAVVRPGHAPPLSTEAAAVLSARNVIRSVRCEEIGYEPVVTREEGLARLAR